MSESYRHPYSAVTGTSSARLDKRFANRGVRRKQNVWLRTQWFEEEMGIVPHRFECSHNEVYSWGRDGHQYLHTLDAHAWQIHLRARECAVSNAPYSGWFVRQYGTWPPRWYEKLKRK